MKVLPPTHHIKWANNLVLAVSKYVTPFSLKKALKGFFMNQVPVPLKMLALANKDFSFLAPSPPILAMQLFGVP